jgi:hypothetical protein
MIHNFNKFSIKSRKKSKWKNNGFRSLFESIIPNEVILALKDGKENYIIIGGIIALSYYIKPRYTEDIDLAFLSYDDIPSNVFKFRRNREHSFEHIKTGVEIELLTPEHLNRSYSFFETIFKNSKKSDGIKIASPESLIALKLRRFNNTDQNDIVELHKYCLENSLEIDLKKSGSYIGWVVIKYYSVELTESNFNCACQRDWNWNETKKRTLQDHFYLVQN